VERLCNGVGRGPLVADLRRAGPPPGGSPVGRNSPLSFQVACRNTQNPAPWWPRRPEGGSSSAARLSPAPETTIRHRASSGKGKKRSVCSESRWPEHGGLLRQGVAGRDAQWVEAHAQADDGIRSQPLQPRFRTPVRSIQMGGSGYGPETLAADGLSDEEQSFVGPGIAHVTPLLPAGMRHCSMIGQSPAVRLVVWYIPRRAGR